MLGGLRLPTVTWPPPDTDRNRFLFRLGFPVAALVALYWIAFAVVSGGWLPYLVSALLVTTTVMLGIGLALMRGQREQVARVERELLARSSSGPGVEPAAPPAPPSADAPPPPPEPGREPGTEWAPPRVALTRDQLPRGGPPPAR